MIPYERTTKLLTEVEPVTILRRYDNDSAVAVLTPAEFRQRFARRDMDAVKTEIKAESGVTLVTVWDQYVAKGQTRVCAHLNGCHIVGPGPLHWGESRVAAVRGADGRLIRAVRSGNVA